MHEETYYYQAEELPCQGFLCYDETLSPGQRPGILLVHTWLGLDPFMKDKARLLAQQGYVAFCADLYGEGRVASNEEEAASLMSPLFLDRSLLRSRIACAYEAVAKLSTVDSEAIGAIGFCFGGLTVIELLRSGLPVQGVVSFHGVIGATLGDRKAKLAPARPFKGSLLLLHGHEDPLVTSEEIAAIEREMTLAQIDWQLHVYGQTSHAFTNPDAHSPEKGLQYQERSAKRAWCSMELFFEKLFAKR